jgi:nucleoside-diphosphate-sugar epimerase
LIRVFANLSNVQLICVSRKSHKDKQNIKWIKGDLGDDKLLSTLQREKYNKIFHIAWEGLPDRSYNISRANLELSKKFLNHFISEGETEFNLMGSCLEYGNIIGPVNDDTEPTGDSDFAKSKIELNEFIKSKKVYYKWYRPFYVYGTGQNSSSLFPTLIKSAKTGEVAQFKSLSNSHDFISVEDLTTAIFKASQVKSIFGEINIGTGLTYTVGDIVKNYYKLNGIVFSEKYFNGPALYSKSTKLDKILKWKPDTRTLQEILEYLIKLSSKI